VQVDAGDAEIRRKVLPVVLLLGDVEITRETKPPLGNESGTKDASVIDCRALCAIRARTVKSAGDFRPSIDSVQPGVVNLRLHEAVPKGQIVARVELMVDLDIERGRVFVARGRFLKIGLQADERWRRNELQQFARNRTDARSRNPLFREGL